jgi:hypothetical protein
VGGGGLWGSKGVDAPAHLAEADMEGEAEGDTAGVADPEGEGVIVGDGGSRPNPCTWHRTHNPTEGEGRREGRREGRDKR